MMYVVAVLLMLVSWVAPSYAANYTLQVILPREAGTGPDASHPNISANHRIFWAYPLIAYEIQAAVIGGKPPFTYSLPSGAPSGMTINASTGVISWTATADATSAGPITFRVVDAESTTVDTTWSISVDSTKFKFIDADYSGTESGTISQPYNTVSDTQSIGTGYIIYFRGATATYNYWGITYGTGGSLGQFRYADYNASAKSIQYLAYPGESPVFDLGKAYEPVLYSAIDTSTDQFTTGWWGDIWATGDRVQVQARRCDYTGQACNPDDTTGTLPTGLSAATDYYIRRVDATHVQLHPTLSDAQNNTNRVDISSTGDSGTLDNYTIIGGSPYLKMYGSPIYFEGFTFQNMGNKGLNFVNDTDYTVIRNNTFQNQYGAGNGMNSGMIDNEGNGTCPQTDVHEFNIYQGNTFTNFIDSAAVKIYAQWKMLFEYNTLYGGHEGATGVVEGLALKGGCMTQPTIRSNVFHDIPTDSLAGNNAQIDGGEYLYNVVYNDSVRGLRINQNGLMSAPFYVERNSFCTPMWVRDGLDTGTDSDVGPFNFVQNVIVNTAGASSPTGITYESVERGGGIVMTNNLAGVAADGIVDSTCKLQGSYRTTWLGSRGYELGAATIHIGISGGVRFNGTLRLQ